MEEHDCGACGKSFGSARALAGHKASCGKDFDGQGSWVCEDCGKEFENPKSYAGHRTGCGELPFDDPDLLKQLYHNQRLSTVDIAERFGHPDPSSVLYCLNKHGIETRSFGDAIRNKYASSLTVNLSHGRVMFQFSEYGEARTFLLSQLVALLDNPAEDVFSDGTNVHHKNGMPLDDRRENLDVLPVEEHLSIHGKEKAERIPRDGAGNFVKR